MHRIRAFTLIELLVALAIIATLATLILQVTARARMSGQQTECASNLRQIGAAMTLFAAEHEDEFPSSAHTDEKTSWIYTLRPYVSNVDKVRICPADPRAEERLQAQLSSYVLNEYICVPLTNPFGRVKESFCRRSLISQPVSTITVFIGADDLDLGVSADHTHSRNWRSWEAVLTDIQPDRFRTGKPAVDRSQGVSNYLYADGHVEALQATWLRNEILQGRNPAYPPQ